MQTSTASGAPWVWVLLVHAVGGLFLIAGGALTLLGGALLADGIWRWWGAGSVPAYLEWERRAYSYWFGIFVLALTLPFVLAGVWLARPPVLRRRWVWVAMTAVYLSPLLLTYLSIALAPR